METLIKPLVMANQSYGWTRYLRGTTPNYVTGTKTVSYVKTSARTIVRDRDRYKFYRDNGYLPQYAYNVTRQGFMHTPGYFRTVATSGGLTAAYGTTAFQTLHQMTADTFTVEAQALAVSTHNQLVAKLNSKVRDQKYSVFETMMEGKKTKKMVVETVTTIAKALLDVKRGRFSKAAKRLGLPITPPGVSRRRRLAANWLEYRYGWMPLYYTVYGEMERQYTRARELQPLYYTTVTSEAYSTPLTVKTLTANTHAESGTSMRMNVVTSLKSKVSVQCKRVAIYRVHNRGIAESTHMGLSNPLLVTWELLPLSFVADWFLNVGALLEQLDTWIGKTYLSGTKTTTYRGTLTATCAKGAAIPGYTVAEFTPASAQMEAISVVRDVDTTTPMVLPQLGMNLNPKRFVDAVALISVLVLPRLRAA